jgi:hypothetical protein
MSFTRAQYRTRILRRMDAGSAGGNSGRWDTTAGAGGEVDQVMGFVYDKEYRRILNANAYYKSQIVQPVADTAGKFTITDLTTGTGDALKRLYRINSVILNSAVYQEVDPRDYIIAPVFNVGWKIWYRRGDFIYVIPVEPSKVTSGTDGFVVSYIPQRIDNLAADGSAVDFPDGYEEIICLEAAAFLLAKGGAETQTTAEFRAMAESLRQDMLSDIARLSNRALSMKFPDFSFDWGG